MPFTIRKLSGDDAARYFPARPLQDLTEYQDALRALNPDDVAEVQLGDVSQRAMKRRLTTAAKPLGITLQYSTQSAEGSIGFRVKQAVSPTATPKRRGRPPKNAS